MPGGGLLAVLDDITAVLDDVAAMSKIAAKKTAGIVGDDLAVNANLVVGLDPRRELPIVGKIALGSLANKVMLIPLALALPARAIQPLLLLGGAFLCYEAFHKVASARSADKPHDTVVQAGVDGAGPRAPVPSPATDPEALHAYESAKVWGAIRTDVILSAEVVAVALGAVADAAVATRALTLTVVGVGMTLGVYGLVAAIVKIDDLGLSLQRVPGEGLVARWSHALGRHVLAFTPVFMRLLSVLGTTAMFWVGGGILLHGAPLLERRIAAAIEAASLPPALDGSLELMSVLIFGGIAGALATPVFHGLGRLFATMGRARRGASDNVVG